MKTLLFAGVAVLALLSGGEVRAQSVVTCVNCVTPAFQLPQWLQNFENQVQMIQYQEQMVINQINFWKTLLLNTADLPIKIFSDITAQINQLEAIVRQADMLGQQTKFMIDQLSAPSINTDTFRTVLTSENQSLSNAMQVMSMAVTTSQTMQSLYASQINTLQAQVPTGMTQAAQIGNQIQATQAQQQAVYMNAQAVAFQALATAELRKAHRETLLDARAYHDLDSAYWIECGYLTVIHPPLCSSGTQTPTTTQVAQQ